MAQRFSAKYVIIGGSVAAVGAIEALRAEDPGSPLALVTEDRVSPYSRPLISHYLTGERDLDGIRYRPPDFYSRLGVKTFLQTRATRVDFPDHCVHAEGPAGEAYEITYEKLLLATGSRPVRPPIQGLEAQGVFSFTSLEDAEAIRAFLPRVKAVVVIGGGLIGLQAAEALSNLGRQVAVVEFQPRILSPVLDAVASGYVEQAFAAHGVRILTSAAAQRVLVDSAGSVAGVALKDGQVLPCQMVIVAAGVTPRTELAGAGFAPAPAPGAPRAIGVDERMQVQADLQASGGAAVYAAGDAALGPDLLSGAARPLPIWPNAYLQGRVAGLNMAGRPTRFRGGLSMNSSHFFGLPVVSAGLFDVPEGADPQEWEVLTLSADGTPPAAARPGHAPRVGTSSSFAVRPGARPGRAAARSGAGPGHPQVPVASGAGPFYRKIILRHGRIVGLVAVGAGIDRAGVLVGAMANGVDCSRCKEDLLRNPGIAALPEQVAAAMRTGRFGSHWWMAGDREER